MHQSQKAKRREKSRRHYENNSRWIIMYEQIPCPLYLTTFHLRSEITSTKASFPLNALMRKLFLSFPLRCYNFRRDTRPFLGKCPLLFLETLPMIMANYWTKWNKESQGQQPPQSNRHHELFTIAVNLICSNMEKLNKYPWKDPPNWRVNRTKEN